MRVRSNGGVVRRVLVAAAAVVTVPLGLASTAGAYDQATCAKQLKIVIGHFDRASLLASYVPTVTNDPVDAATRTILVELAAARSNLSKVNSGSVLPSVQAACDAANAKITLGGNYVKAMTIYLTADAVVRQSNAQLAVANAGVANRALPGGTRWLYGSLIPYITATKVAGMNVNAELDKLVPKASTLDAAGVNYLESFTIFLAQRSAAADQALKNIPR